MQIKSISEDYSQLKSENNLLRDQVSKLERNSKYFRDQTNSTSSKTSKDQKKMKQINSLVNQYRKENDRFIDKINILKDKITNNTSVENLMSQKKYQQVLRDKLESTTSNFSDEEYSMKDLHFRRDWFL